MRAELARLGGRVAVPRKVALARVGGSGVVPHHGHADSAEAFATAARGKVTVSRRSSHGWRDGRRPTEGGACAAGLVGLLILGCRFTQSYISMVAFLLRCSSP